MAERYRYGLPFRLAVGSGAVSDALAKYKIRHRTRVFDPQTTIWTWMSQIASGSASCRQAVSEVVAHHAVAGRSISARTGAYTQARQRLDTRVVRRLARELARRTEAECKSHWLLGRPLLAVDGTTVSCPDTESIVAQYPKQAQNYTAEGMGFPLIRLLFITSLTTGSVIDTRMSPFKGKHTNEFTLFVRAWDQLERGDASRDR